MSQHFPKLSAVFLDFINVAQAELVEDFIPMVKILNLCSKTKKLVKILSGDIMILYHEFRDRNGIGKTE